LSSEQKAGAFYRSANFPAGQLSWQRGHN